MIVGEQRQKKIHREATALAEAKKALGFPVVLSAVSPAASSIVASNDADGRVAATPATSIATESVTTARKLYENYGLSITAVNAYLLRYLRSKHLSVDEALAKLRRRRVFERTLPTISVTPTTVAALRSGALHLLGNDLEGRPILYVNISAFSLPTLELDEAQRLLVILLEFMQAQCLLKNNEDDAEARQQRAASAANGKPTSAESVREAEREATRHLQQFTVLINEEGAAWGTHESFLRNSGTFFSMFPKYYPMMLGAVLVLGASFEIRMAIKACVGNSPDDVRDTVRMIDRPVLTRFMHPHTIPVELGGQKQVAGSAMNFSEAVLRHWFTLTSQMEEENAVLPSSATSSSGAAAVATAATTGWANEGRKSGANSDEERERLAQYHRPLYVPPPPLRTTQQLIARQRQTIELQHLTDATAGGVSTVRVARSRSAIQHPDAQRGFTMGPSIAAVADGMVLDRDNKSFTSSFEELKERRGKRDPRPRADAITDDGICSELFDEEDGQNANGFSEYADEPSATQFSHGAVTTNHMFTAASISALSEGEIDFNGTLISAGSMAPATGRAITPAEVSHYTAHPEAAIAALRLERQRREQAEQALQFRDLGVTLDLRNASTIEKELASLHHDLNVLVAEVLVKAEMARRRQGIPPTLIQLLDLTLNAFEAVTSTPSTVPAMALAQPCQREAGNSSCCSFM